MADDMNFNPTTADFEALLNESLGGASDFAEGTVIKGKVVGIEKDVAIIDIGLKTEGRISVKEFGVDADGKATLKVGDTVEVFLERVENALGEAVISREKAKREEAWTRLEEVFARNEPVNGAIVGRVKGGFTVDLGGASAFLPGSQVDIRPVRDVGPLMGKEQPFAILKMDRPRGNIVVSRRAILEEARAEQRTELVSQLQEGEIREGVVKNITDYGAFVDLGGIDGLLHVTDMSWKRVNHPSQVLAVGDTVKVQIVKINPDTQRISLGMKQLQSDPWDGVEAKYPVGAKFTGRITNITDYGAFVELEAGVEGLVHVSEMSWTKKNVHPGKIVSTSQEVDVIVLDVDSSKRRVSLGLKQAAANPWEKFLADHPIGSTVEGEVKNATEFGLFIGLDGEIDGMVHLSDLDWAVSGEEALAKYKKGDMVKARVLDVDVEKERISLGVKQLAGDPLAGDSFRKGQTVTCTVTEITSGGIEVKFGEEDAPMTAFIRKSDLSRDRQEQRPERFAVGDRVDAQVTAIDKAARRVSVSIKALEMMDEKAAIEQYGSSDSGASLGDILGAALREKASKD
ncbi:30S ribosomal protein S1 [Caulobacter sp. NIBR1757]|uniref:30S ribosomal protein S1 n=1 Tax=Caulobacter sp. NIBR1757 TaxID=3016000 RepID=UPI0022F024D2|nr:30S ribosomal protein S1 [Caulobacter sp. NIBR1757]WGM37341.1 30S ribosomal protein S1 [Caulobacter sp. NIBR1757]